MKPVRVGLLGMGTVGGGTFNVLRRNSEEIARRAGRRIEMAQVADKDPAREAEYCTENQAFTTDAWEVVKNPEIDIVVELIGGTGLARELTMAAIANGKHVATANKALIALHGNEIFDAAQERGVMVAFEAAVGGGISIIKVMREGLAGNRIEWLAGIINGTGNYILTAMEEQGADFGTVLADAQRLGYAEADPTFDVEGVDAAHKLTILASIAFGIPLQYAKVYREGISAITREDIEHARELGYRIKHLGIARRDDRGIELRVHPTLIPERRLMANVDGVMNAILVMGDAVGPTLHYGAGAGAEPTASAVVADLVDIARAITTDPGNRVPHLAFQPGSMASLPILSMEEVETAYYLRLAVINRPGVLGAITGLLGEAGISIEAIQQKGSGELESRVEIIFLTQRTVERKMNQALEKIHALPAVAGEAVRIRMETLS